MKKHTIKHIAIITGLSLCLIAAPFTGRAQDATSSPSPAADAHDGKHRDINEFMDKHPKLKEKVLAKFDANHDGKLEADEIAAFKQWRKEHREEFKEWCGRHHKKAEAASPAASPAVTK